jgi:hypothetical protein
MVVFAAMAVFAVAVGLLRLVRGTGGGEVFLTAPFGALTWWSLHWPYRVTLDGSVLELRSVRRVRLVPVESVSKVFWRPFANTFVIEFTNGFVDLLRPVVGWRKLRRSFSERTRGLS